MNLLDFFSKYHRFIIFGGLFLAVLSFIDKTLAIGVIFIVFLTSATLFFLNKTKEEKQKKLLGILFLITFSLHILGVLFIYYANFQPFSGGKGNYTTYHSTAEQISNRIRQGDFSLEGLNVGRYYPVIVGYIYALTAPAMLMGQIVNAWMVAITIIFVYLIVREIGRSEKEAFLVGLIASIYPSLAFFGSLLLKEALVVLVFAIGLLLMLQIIKRFSWSRFFIFCVVLIALTNLRFYVSYALILTFIICWLLFSNTNIKKKLVYVVIFIIIMGFLPQIVPGKGMGQGYFGINNLKTFLKPKEITYYREILYSPFIESSTKPPSQLELDERKDEHRDSSFIVATGLENPLMFMKNTLLSFVYTVLGPFPWQMKKAKHLLALPETIAWYFLFFYIIKGIIKSIRKQYKVILPFIVFSCFVFGALALFINNFGIITRIRMPAFLALLCLFPLGFERLKNIKIPFFKYQNL